VGDDVLEVPHGGLGGVEVRQGESVGQGRAEVLREVESTRHSESKGRDGGGHGADGVGVRSCVLSRRAASGLWK